MHLLVRNINKYTIKNLMTAPFLPFKHKVHKSEIKEKEIIHITLSFSRKSNLINYRI